MCAFSQSESGKYFEWIIMGLINFLPLKSGVGGIETGLIEDLLYLDKNPLKSIINYQ